MVMHLYLAPARNDISFLPVNFNYTIALVYQMMVLDETLLRT
jgi:hypothetical protein